MTGRLVVSTRLLAVSTPKDLKNLIKSWEVLWFSGFAPRCGGNTLESRPVMTEDTERNNRFFDETSNLQSGGKILQPWLMSTDGFDYDEDIYEESFVPTEAVANSTDQASLREQPY